MATYRIDFYKQIHRFFAIVFSGEHDFRPKHISLYMFLLNQNNRNKWAEWFKVPLDTGMHGSRIASKRAYYDALYFLQQSGVIKYEKGVNEYKAPKISLVVLREEKIPQQIPQSEPTEAPEPIPQQGIQTDKQSSTQGGKQVRMQGGKQNAPTIKSKTKKNKTLNSRQEKEKKSLYYIGRKEIFDLQNFFETTFPDKAKDLKKNYGAQNFKKYFAEFSKEHLNKKWRDNDDLRKHVASFIRIRFNKNGKKVNHNDLSPEELQDKYNA